MHIQPWVVKHRSYVSVCAAAEEIVYISAEEAYASSSVEVNNLPSAKNKAAAIKHNCGVSCNQS